METKLFLRTVTVSGAGVLRFSDIPIMCLRASDDNGAVIWVKNVLDNTDAIFDHNRLIGDSSRAQFILA